MKLEKRRLLLGICVGISFVLLLLSHLTRNSLAQPTPEGKKQQAQIGTIEDMKKKGFDGVDFSYDSFGASPGQDSQKIADEVMKKDMAEKSDVMKRHRMLLSERYDLNCRSEKTVVMTKGKLQPIGPAVKLP
ncbi:MAG TPA: hypothetical protein VF732_10450, partial [Nitrospira sp.]